MEVHMPTLRRYYNLLEGSLLLLGDSKYRAFHSTPHLAVTGAVEIHAFSKWNW
jgi:hypothetical protein